MSRRFMDGPPVETYSAEERGAILEREVDELLAAGGFRFLGGVGFLYMNVTDKPCGCAVGAVIQALGGLGQGGAYATAVDTGLVTEKELGDLEQGYECGKEVSHSGRHASGPFFEFGRRLRARPDADPTWERKSAGSP